MRATALWSSAARRILQFIAQWIDHRTYHDLDYCGQAVLLKPDSPNHKKTLCLWCSHQEHAGMAAALSSPRILPSGDAAITVEFSRNIDDEANRRVLALDRLLASAQVEGVIEAVPTYRSLLVHYDPVRIDYKALGARLMALAEQQSTINAPSRRWRIPVSYGGEHGIDLEDAAEALNLPPEILIARHVGPTYRVAMIGFTPGWSYLSGLDPTLELPRRHDPRLLTPPGTISIGGVQTGIQCLAGPSGWHLLGRTPVRTYQLHRDPVFLLEPGDEVEFHVIDAREFAERDRAAECGEIVARLMTT